MFIVGDMVQLKPKEECSRSYNAPCGMTARVTKGTYLYVSERRIIIKWSHICNQADGPYPIADFELAKPKDVLWKDYPATRDLIPRFKQIAEEL